MDSVVILGDCLQEMKNLDASSVDMVFTSPPYAERRKDSYGGVPAGDYVGWFLPIAREICRVLKPDGHFFLNIKPHTEDGERSLYVFDLVCELRRSVGFKFIDEFCWTKNPFPGALRGRFKNAFEPVYHFGHPDSDIASMTFNALACGSPVKGGSLARARRKQSGSPVNGSGMAALRAKNMLNVSIVRPSNVVHVNNVSNQYSPKQHHPATFPAGLVEFFVKSFSNEGDVVMDPFAGSGTVGAVCDDLGRKFILIEKEIKYYNLCFERLNSKQLIDVRG